MLFHLALECDEFVWLSGTIFQVIHPVIYTSFQNNYCLHNCYVRQSLIFCCDMEFQNWDVRGSTFISEVYKGPVVSEGIFFCKQKYYRNHSSICGKEQISTNNYETVFLSFHYLRESFGIEETLLQVGCWMLIAWDFFLTSKFERLTNCLFLNTMQQYLPHDIDAEDGFSSVVRSFISFAYFFL